VYRGEGEEGVPVVFVVKEVTAPGFVMGRELLLWSIHSRVMVEKETKVGKEEEKESGNEGESDENRKKREERMKKWRIPRQGIEKIPFLREEIMRLTEESTGDCGGVGNRESGKNDSLEGERISNCGDWRVATQASDIQK